MASLYELTGTYAAMLDRYDMAETDEEREEILFEIGALDGDIADKAEQYARVIRNKTAEAQGFKGEIERLTARKKAAENLVERLKQGLLDAMTLTGQTEIKTSIGKWRTQKNPWSCDVTDADSVPKEYHIPQPDKIDKLSILRAFKESGEIIDGCVFKQEVGVRFR